MSGNHRASIALAYPSPWNYPHENFHLKKARAAQSLFLVPHSYTPSPMPIFRSKSWLLAGLLALAPVAHGADDLNALLGLPAVEDGADQPQGLVVIAETVPAEVAPGGDFEVVVHVTAPPGTHAFPDAAQKPSQASTIYFLSAGGLQFAPPVWPKGEKHEYKALEMTDVIYHGEQRIRIPGKAGQTPGTYVAKGAFKGAYCDDVGQCYMAKEYPWQVEVKVKAPAPVVAPPAKVEASGSAPVPAAVPAKGLTVTAEAVPVVVAPGDAFEIVVQVAVGEGLHAYPDAAQNSDSASSLRIVDAGTMTLGKPVWPAGIPHQNVAGETERVYQGKVQLRITAAAPAMAGTYGVKGVFTGFYCDDKGHCFPVEEYPWQAQVIVDATAPPSLPPALPAATHSVEPIVFDLPWGKVSVDPNTGLGLGSFLLLSAIGGFVLNFMPCVLPVIPIKIMGLAQAAGTRSRRLLLGGVMSGGVVALWLGIGSVLAFTSVLGGTADIFRYPVVNLSLGLFIIVMAFAATGLFAIRLPQGLYRISPKHDSLAGSFGFGLMTGVFALPCTGPFMGTAAATVLGAGDSMLTLMVFGAIGFGMAVPYFALAANPKWVEKLPRSGPASDVMKNFLGWLMLAGGAYFVQSGVTQWVQPESHFGKRAGVMVALALFTIASLMLVKGCVSLWTSGSRKVITAVFLVIGLALGALGGQQIYTEIATRPFPFITLSDEAQLSLGKGKLTVVDFRSTNCLNCDYNEKTVFNTPVGKALLGAQDVAAYQANIDHDANARYLRRISGQVAVPFLIIYNAKGEPVEKMSAIITTEQLRLGLEKARQQN